MTHRVGPPSSSTARSVVSRSPRFEPSPIYAVVLKRFLIVSGYRVGREGSHSPLRSPLLAPPLASSDLRRHRQADALAAARRQPRALRTTRRRTAVRARGALVSRELRLDASPAERGPARSELERAASSATPSRRRRRGSVRFTDPLAPDLATTSTIGADGWSRPALAPDHDRRQRDRPHPSRLRSPPEHVLLNPQPFSAAPGDTTAPRSPRSAAAAAERRRPQLLLVRMRSSTTGRQLDDAGHRRDRSGGAGRPERRSTSASAAPCNSRSIRSDAARVRPPARSSSPRPGNEGDDGNPAIYPAAYPHVLTVGASDRAAALRVLVASPCGRPGGARRGRARIRSTRRTTTSSRHELLGADGRRGRRLDSTQRAGARSVSQLSDLRPLSARDLAPPGYDERTGFGVLDIPAALAAPVPPAIRRSRTTTSTSSPAASSPLRSRSCPRASRPPRRRSRTPRDVYRVCARPRSDAHRQDLARDDDARRGALGSAT